MMAAPVRMLPFVCSRSYAPVRMLPFVCSRSYAPVRALPFRRHAVIIESKPFQKESSQGSERRTNSSKLAVQSSLQLQRGWGSLS